MDGFAVVAADTVGAPVTLDIVETIAAGHAPTVEVGPGQASRIFTGAPMPAGADAVVMVERTAPCDGDRVHVEIEVPVGNHVRPVGDDLDIGAVVFSAGDVLTAAHLGVLNSLGVETVSAHPRMRVGVVSTGDELVEGGGALAPGQIRDSNRRTLLALAAQAGCDVVDLGIARDTEAEITAAIERGVSECDAGADVGRRVDGRHRPRQGHPRPHRRDALDADRHQAGQAVRVRAGRRRPRVRLPRQPGVVDGELRAVRPAGAASGDGPHRTRPTDGAGRRRLRAATATRDGKIHFARVVASHGADGRVHVASAGGQGSHQLGAMAAANALAVLPDGDGVDAGGDVEVLLLDDLPSELRLPS